MDSPFHKGYKLFTATDKVVKFVSANRERIHEIWTILSAGGPAVSGMDRQFRDVSYRERLDSCIASARPAFDRVPFYYRSTHDLSFKERLQQ